MSFVEDLENLGYKYPVTGFITGVLIAIGLAKLLFVGFSFSSMIISLWILPPVNFKKYGAKSGAWALVTGATAGLGEEFAYQLASKGFNILVLSRSQEKLGEVEKNIREKYKVDTRNFVMDVANATDSDYQALTDYVQDLKLSVLINNVGVSHNMPVPFSETSTKELKSIIDINNTGTLRITQAVLPRIENVVSKSSKERVPRGLIINMSSFAGLIPTALLATYAGSKAFLQAWGIALGEELKSKNIDVDNPLSFLVTSNMSKIKRTSVSIPNPKNFIRALLRNAGRRVGAQERVYASTPYWSHALMHWAIENTVGVFSSTAVSINHSMHVDIRRRALRKAERLSKEK
jgi:17beta-estradiol 17-dehydrogenase / very-long-chain 3-oxoacyl-CoA reductase